jgi:hypothetical protein
MINQQQLLNYSTSRRKKTSSSKLPAQKGVAPKNFLHRPFTALHVLLFGQSQQQTPFMDARLDHMQF